ncbi:50S ribosomal protein L18 [Candidatus Woesearchaeota archaeon]|jgi:large subunit ribosomal protein L18|nr:50S ribosomal protein L18 [Candidatus Woesearchaeota archaeon]MBT5397322.1 50S ribosomal protein L18 [Candidatus Woesearchaeota archaeon]MBT5924803.1 50S ribosomal protein L18 [Candidatus Woesearchaeota archaeon]MBT6367833.1 50S ribosomal protein L18 [Candidatus Woesearchaeota archaeon]MBT7762722.1 50S ribosomal protein L18 [Candidatus Woesearchaeota archaeon]
MARNKPKSVLYRRRRERKTDYKKRRTLLLSQKPRVVFRSTNNKIIGQIVSFEPKGDKVLVGVDSTFLAKHGWKYSYKNIPAAYLTGLSLGKSALEHKITDAVFDTGFKTPHRRGKAYAFLKGLCDAGLNVPHGDDSIFPDDARLSGAHIQNYGKVVAEKEGSSFQFTQYLKNKVLPENITAEFEKIKQKLISKAQ